MKLTVYNTYTCWQEADSDKVVYVSISDLITVGTPIDQDGVELEQLGDTVFKNDGKGGYCPIEG